MGYQPFAKGKLAFGYCDQCDQRYPLSALTPQVYDMIPTGFLHCPTCLDEDQPQLFLGRFPVSDPQALRNPRPDVNRISSISLFGWAPVGNPLTNSTDSKLGTVTVLITKIAPTIGIAMNGALGVVTAVAS